MKIDKQLLIDADRIVYACGFACEKRTYSITGKTFNTKTTLKKFLEESCLPMDEVAETVVLEPIAYCLHSVKMQLEGLIGLGGDRTQAHIFLGGKDNFRLKIDPLYKANRINNQKPVYYHEIREYMQKYFGAEIVDCMEADDICAMLQTDDTCIVSGDKDLLQVPGWHYNPQKQKLVLMSPTAASMCFYQQMLAGDATDNIKGLGAVPERFIEECELHPSSRKGCGLISASRLLEMCATPEQMHQRVLDIYLEKHGGDYEKGFGDFLKQGQLLYLCRDLEPETGYPRPWDGQLSQDYRTDIEGSDCSGGDYDGGVHARTGLDVA